MNMGDGVLLQNKKGCASRHSLMSFVFWKIKKKKLFFSVGLMVLVPFHGWHGTVRSMLS